MAHIVCSKCGAKEQVGQINIVECIGPLCTECYKAFKVGRMTPTVVQMPNRLKDALSANAQTDGEWPEVIDG